MGEYAGNSRSEDAAGGVVYVGGLNENVKKEDLEKEFKDCGKMKSVWVAFNPPGFAFVEFENLVDAEDACYRYNGTEILGSKIKVELSRRRSRGDRNARGGRGGSGGFRGGSRGFSNGGSREGGGGGGYQGSREGGGGFRGAGTRGGWRRGSFQRDSFGGGGGGEGGRGRGRGGYRGGRDYSGGGGQDSYGGGSGGGGYEGGARFRSRSPAGRGGSRRDFGDEKAPGGGGYPRRESFDRF